jgi:hypothetical protein
MLIILVITINVSMQIRCIKTAMNITNGVALMQIQKLMQITPAQAMAVITP